MKSTRVFCPGVWDLLHRGHIKCLQIAYDLGDALYIGMCSDSLVLKTKGNRPIMSEAERFFALDNLWLADQVLTYDVSFIHWLKSEYIDILAIGPEYGQEDYQKETLKWCKENGVEVKVIPRTEGISTTEIIERVKKWR